MSNENDTRTSVFEIKLLNTGKRAHNGDTLIDSIPKTLFTNETFAYELRADANFADKSTCFFFTARCSLASMALVLIILFGETRSWEHVKKKGKNWWNELSWLRQWRTHLGFQSIVSRTSWGTLQVHSRGPQGMNSEFPGYPELHSAEVRADCLHKGQTGVCLCECVSVWRENLR